MAQHGAYLTRFVASTGCSLIEDRRDCSTLLGPFQWRFAEYARTTSSHGFAVFVRETAVAKNTVNKCENWRAGDNSDVDGSDGIE